MEAVGADDACGMLVVVVEKKSWENEEVQKFVKERGFLRVGKTKDTYILLQEGQEEEISDADLIDFEEACASDKEKVLSIIFPPPILEEQEGEISDADFIGVAGIAEAGTSVLLEPDEASASSDGQTRACFVKMCNWTSTNQQQLKDVGVKTLNLSMELTTQKAVDTRVPYVGRNGSTNQVNLKKGNVITITLNSITIELEEEPSTIGTMERVVHKLEIKFTPADYWAGDTCCRYVKVSPNSSREITIQETKSMMGTITLGASNAPIQVGATTSRGVSEVVRQHEWRSQVYPKKKAAAWIWSIYYWSDGRLFNPSKTSIKKSKGGKISKALIEKLLAPDLTSEPSLQLNPEDVQAKWMVDTSLLHPFDFKVEVTLNTTAFHRVNILKGCYGWLVGSRLDPQHEVVDYDHLSV